MNFVYINQRYSYICRYSGAKEACTWIFVYCLSWKLKTLVYIKIINYFTVDHSEQVVKNLKPATSPFWLFVRYCHITLSMQYCVYLNRSHQVPSVASSCRLSPAAAQVPNPTVSLKLYSVYSNWYTAAFGYPYTAVQQTWNTKKTI